MLEVFVPFARPDIACDQRVSLKELAYMLQIWEISLIILAAKEKDVTPTIKGTALVQEFISLHREELANMWETGVYKKLPPIK